MKTLEELKLLVVSSFDSDAMPGEIVDSSPNRISAEPELQEIMSELQGKHWKQVKTPFVADHFDALPLLTEAAFRFYLPAYILASLNMFNSRENPLFPFVVYALNPVSKEGNLEQSLCKVFNNFKPKQTEAIVAFLEFAAYGVPDPFKVSAASIALDMYWRKRN